LLTLKQVREIRLDLTTVHGEICCRTLARAREFAYAYMVRACAASTSIRAS
jgi:hypothetical protein